MTRSKLITEIAGLVYLGAGLLVYLRPEYTWIFFAAAGLFIGAMIYAALHVTPADRERMRRGAWLIPAATLAVGAQVVYSAAPDERFRAWLLAGSLVAGGLVLFAVRRRAR